MADPFFFFTPGHLGGWVREHRTFLGRNWKDVGYVLEGFCPNGYSTMEIYRKFGIAQHSITVDGHLWGHIQEVDSSRVSRSPG